MSEPDPSRDDGALGVVLLGTLNRAAEAAPPPPPDLYRTVTRRYARRRSGLVATAAAVTVLVLLGGVVGVLRVIRHEPAPVTTPTTVEGLWPDAVRTLPTKIGDADYTVEALLADGRTIVHARDLRGLDAIAMLDPDGRPAPYQLVVGYSRAMLPDVQIADVVANDGWLVWRLSRRGSADQIWSMRWSGDRPRLLAEAGSLGSVPSIALDGDRVIYGPSPTGVRSVPAAGGVPTLFPGTGGRYWRLHWPWLVVGSGMNRAPDAPIELWNLRTGERITAKFRQTDYSDACGPVWCVARGATGDRIVTARVDGTGRRAWPGYRTNHIGLTPIVDRYLPLYREGRTAGAPGSLDLVDVVTGRAVKIRTMPETTPPTFLGTGRYFVSWLVDGRHKKVLDLREID